MNENEKHLPQQDKKLKIRERYRGIDESSLDVIPAIPREYVILSVIWGLS